MMTLSRFLVFTFAACAAASLGAADRKLVMIAGPVSHPPLMHEFRAGSMLLQKRLVHVPGLKTLLITNGWPTKVVDGQTVDDNSVFEGADAVFIYSDGGGKHLAVQNNRLEVLVPWKLERSSACAACLSGKGPLLSRWTTRSTRVPFMA